MARDTCYFDGQCGFCRRTARWLRRLDWLGRLEFEDMSACREEDLPVPLPDAMRGMPMRTGGGRVHVGYPAVRRAMLQTPVGFLPAGILYIPGISHAGRVVYQLIADRRPRDALCHTPLDRR